MSFFDCKGTIPFNLLACPSASIARQLPGIVRAVSGDHLGNVAAFAGEVRKAVGWMDTEHPGLCPVGESHRGPLRNTANPPRRNRVATRSWV
jgi:hypothetical protein